MNEASKRREMRKSVQVQRPELKKVFRLPTSRWANNIKRYLKKVERYRVD
jgi:hypothetical protein